MSDIYGDLNLKNGKILNLKLESLATDPTFTESDAGRMYYNTEFSSIRFNDGDEWITVQFSNNSSNPLKDTLGANWINADLSFNPTAFNDLDNISGLNSNSTLFSVIAALDTAISNINNIAFADVSDVNFGSLETADVIIFDGTNFTNIDLNTLAHSRLELSTFDLEDTLIESPSAGDIFIFSNDEGKFVNRKIYAEYTNLAANTSFVVTHNLGIQYCTVTPINMVTTSLITIPYTIVYNNTNQFTITFDDAVPVKLLIWAFNQN